MKKRIQSIIVSAGTSILQAMQKITQAPHEDPPGPTGMVLVTDESGKLAGVVTDGDIRRAILRGISLETSIETITNKNPITVQSTIPPHDMLAHMFQEIRSKNILDSQLEKLIVVEENGKPVDVISFFELWKRSDVKTRPISIVGLGYVGLTLGLTFAEAGFNVVGIDVNPNVVKTLQSGEAHFFERGLDELLKAHLGKRFFVQDKFSSERLSDVYIVCVGTPVDDVNEPRMDYLETAIKEVAKILKPNDLIVLRSTVPIGTCKNFVIPLIEKETDLKIGQDFFLSFAPERTAEGKALEEVRTVPQIIGAYNKASGDLTSNLFKIFAKSIIPVSSLEAAEAVKLLNNTFRDLIFSYANEMSQIFDALNINTHEVIKAANEGYTRDRIPLPSPGVGGACLSKDPFILLKSTEAIEYKPKLPLMSREINESMIPFITNKVFDFLSTRKREKINPKILILGVAFKGEPETSDLRGSTPVAIAKIIQERYKNIHVYDPVVSDEDIKSLGVHPTTLEEGFANADCVLILNNHRSFSDLDIYTLTRKLAPMSLLFDGWGIFLDYDFSPIENVHYDSLGAGHKRKKQN